MVIKCGLLLLKMSNIFDVQDAASVSELESTQFAEAPAPRTFCDTEMTKAIELDTELVYYRSTGNKYLYIFNHEKFENTRYFSYKTPSTRHGTMEDVYRLETIFSTLGYKVITYNNLKYDVIINTILEISKQEHSGTCCLCFAFLTHGNKGGKLYASDREYEFGDVTAPFHGGHSSLVGIPKIYFVQACRGSKTDPGRTLQLDGGRAQIVIPSYADFLIYNASVEDYVSFRNIDGSFMIQELCDVIERYRDELDIQRIITIVNKRVAYHATAYAPQNKHIHEKKQMPEVRHTLTKLFKF